MANSNDQIAVSSNDMCLAINSKSMDVVSTLYESIPLFGLMGIHAHKKPEAVFGVGDPDPNGFAKGAAFGGAKIDPVRLAEAERIGTYSPLVQVIRQNDSKSKVQRDTGVIASSHSGTTAVITFTTTAGVITGSTISTAGTGYAGAAPYLDIVDATGSTGYGAIATATITAGAVSAVTIVSGGRGYASSGVGCNVNAGASAGEKYSRYIFKWAGKESIGTVYDNDVNDSLYALKEAPDFDEDKAKLSLVANEMAIQATEQAEALANDFWYGMPTVGNTDSTRMYDQPFGLINAIDDSNVYGGVDRSLTANAWARAKVDASSHPGWGLKAIVQDAEQKKGLAYKSGGLDVVVVSPTMFQRMESEEIAFSQNINIKDELREYGKYGFKSKVLQFGPTYAIADWRCPDGTALGLNMKALLILFNKGKKFTPSALTKQNGVRVGPYAGIDGSTFTINTEWMPMVVAPQLCVKYTGLDF